MRLDAGAEKLILAKGVFHCEYFDNLQKFNDVELPLKDAFYSHLSEERISDAEYERAQAVWKKFDC